MNKENILIIEDDEDIREGIRILLENESCTVTEAADGYDGLSKLNNDTDLVILDVMMPGLSGLQVCERIRKTSNVPILFLTAKAQESDKLIALMAGGDDYLTKPFSYSELLGRIKALIRRYKVYLGKSEAAIPNESFIELSGIKISTSFNSVTVDGKDIDLTSKEYQILLLLMSYPGKIFSSQNLYESIWEEPFFYSCNSTVMVHIRKLRKKIEKDPNEPVYICTVWGKGYRFENKN